MPDRKKVLNDLQELCEYLFHEYKVCYKGDEGDIYNRFLIANNALDLLKEQRWHMLTEDAYGIIRGLPGDDGRYIMTDGKDIWIDDYVDGVADGIILDSGRDIREIKAWMYAPEPPEEVKQDEQ